MTDSTINGSRADALARFRAARDAGYLPAWWRCDPHGEAIDLSDCIDSLGALHMRLLGYGAMLAEPGKKIDASPVGDAIVDLAEELHKFIEVLDACRPRVQSVD